jgi:peptidyl-prolyl cis-trans isomerase D
MLIAMRKGAAGWVAKILFFFLILSFAAWGIGDYLTPEANPVLAEVGEIEVRRDSVDAAERRQLEQMRQLLGTRFDASSLPEGAIRAAALDQLIGQAALDMEAQHLGVTAGEDAVRNAIMANPAFRTQGGTFDANRFRQALYNAGVSEDGYVIGLQKELVRQQVGEAVAIKLPPPQPLAELMYMLETQKRAIATTSLPLSAVTPPAPSEAQVKEFIEANKQLFSEPERRDTRVLYISVPNVAAATVVSDADVSNYYELNKANFVQPETRTLTQALFTDATAAKTFKQIAPKDPEAFTTAAEFAGALVTDLGALQRGAIFPASIGEAIYDLPTAGLTEAVESRLGWHVVLVSEINPEATTPLADVQAAITEQIRQERANNGLIDVANAAEDALAAGGDLDAASKATGINITTVSGYSRAGTDSAGLRLHGLPSDQTFIDTVFDRNAGDQSGLIELRDGSFVSIIVDKITPTSPKPFEDVREDATTAWQAEQQEEAALAQAKALGDAVDAAAFKAAATAIGLSVTELAPKNRQALQQETKIPANLIESAFAAAEKSSVQAINGENVDIVYVEAVERPTFDPKGEAEAAYLAQLANVYANDRVEVLGAVAREANPATINNVPEPPPGGQYLQ